MPTNGWPWESGSRWAHCQRVEPEASTGVPWTSLRTGSAGCRVGGSPTQEVATDCAVEVENKNGETMGSNTRKKRFLIGIFLLMAIHLSWAQTPDRSFDTVITNGHIIDGTGSPWYSGDIGIRDDKIAAIGNLSAAQRTRTIDVHGMVVAPGFIDMLGQSELTILVDPRLPSKIYQGITTEITGEGNSIAPLNDAIIQSDRKSYEYYHLTPDWKTLGQYFSRLERQGMGINL